MLLLSLLVCALIGRALVQGQAGMTEESEDTYLPECNLPLGMASGAIPDSALSASSSFDVTNVGPLSSRIRTERKGGAWCPQSQIAKDVYEYLEIDLGRLMVISRVETQGRFGNGQGLEWAPQYMLEYQRSNGSHWIRFRNKQNVEYIDGNVDTYTAQIRELHPPIITRRIRFVPYSTHPRTICMRVELYGCVWKDNTLSYSIRQGDTRGQEVDFFDFSYDGQIVDNQLSGGLGQLVDFEEGDVMFRMDKYNIGKKGYEWVGWKNDSLPNTPVEMVLEFDVVMNFTAVKLHCNNLFSKDIRVFRSALLFFSIGGEHYLGEPVQFENWRDEAVELPRYEEIPLYNKIGKFVKIQLFFDSRWMLVSEVRFVNAPAVGEFIAEVPPPTKAIGKVTDAPIQEILAITNSGVSTPSNGQGQDTYIGIIIGALSALIVLVVVIVIIVFIRHQRHRKCKYNGSPMKMFIGHDHINFDVMGTNSHGSKGCNGNLYRGVATEDSQECDKENSWTKLTPNNKEDTYIEDVQARKLPELPRVTAGASEGVYASTDVSNLYPNLVVNLPPHPVYTGPLKEDSPPPPPPPYPRPHAMCAAMGTCPELMNLQGLTGNSVYATPANDFWFQTDNTPVPEYPRDNLRFIAKVGEGQFGEVHLCEAVGLQGNDRILTAVKMLRPDACLEARDDFHKEINVLARLNNPNIVRVLGVCTTGEPLMVLVEYMQHGDLHEFLLKHYPENTLGRGKNQPTLSYGTLIYTATQIASGMRYLESLNMVHRDLAARNCLVGPNYLIKISDFGMSRGLYSRDYYRIEGKAMLPIRWMAWESILLGKFSTKSDVWSFAVTLWEILTFAREQPYCSLNDDAVIENCGHCYHDDGTFVCLPPPIICPKEIFDLMCECWNRDEMKRPSFFEIHKFLEGKNRGYFSQNFPRPICHISG